MSVFRVNLSNNKQGLMDINPATDTGKGGVPFGTSIQREMYAAGPKGAYYLLKDGATFTDCNYWKQFTAENVGLEHSFIEVIEDDGSVYQHGVDSLKNVGDQLTLTNNYADNVVNFVDDFGGTVKFFVVQNLDDTHDASIEINGDSDVTMVVHAGGSLLLNREDINLNSIRLKALSGTPTVQYISSIVVPCNS